MFYHLPYYMADFITDWVRKNQEGTPIYRGNVGDQVVRPYGIFNAPEANYLTLVHSHPLQPHLFKTARIMMDLGVVTTQCLMII